MDKKRLEYYKKKLVTRREELLRGIARTEQEGREADEDPTVDLADKAANSYTKEFLFGQTHNDRSLLQLVDDALARIKDGSFGECISCHQELQQKRVDPVLHLLPGKNGTGTALGLRILPLRLCKPSVQVCAAGRHSTAARSIVKISSCRY